MTKPPINRDPTQERLIVLTKVLFDDNSRDKIGVLPLLDMIERLAQNDPKSRNLFTNKVAGTIADYSLLAECQRQILLFQPWASTFEQHARERQGIIRSNYIELTKRMGQVEKALGTIDTSAADPSYKKFDYPAEKRKTKENTLAMQKSEKNLDDFWRAIDRVVLKTANDSLLSPYRTLQRTPDWIELAPKVSLEDKKKKKKKKKGTQVEELMQGLELRSESTIDSKEAIQQQKDKVKTRGTADAAAEKTLVKKSTNDTDVSSQIDHQPTFKLDKRALKVFSALFYQPSESSQPGEIPWIDFLHAMRETGFTAAKMGGSAWHFSPVNSDLGRSIQFHEPHPSNKIPFNIARGIGRRLFRNFGWRGDMFVPADSKV